MTENHNHNATTKTALPGSETPAVSDVMRTAGTADRHIEILKKQAAEYLAGWQRAKADYLNLKKQTEKEKEEVVKFAHAAFVLELLPIYDNLKRALAHVPPEERDKEWVKGVGHILQQFRQLFQTFGIEEIKTLGTTFDPNLHHAFAKEKRQGVAHGMILEEVKTGFTMNGRVITPAQVRVAE